MRHLLVGLLLVTCMLPVAAGAMKVATNLVETGGPHRFADLDAPPLWTSEVVAVDARHQTYERLPAVMVAEENRREAPNARQAIQQASAGGLATEVAAADEDPASSSQSAMAQSWCSTRYRSYDPTDNTYQPYGGGPRIQCQAPLEVHQAAAQSTAASVQPVETTQARWCMQRYSSYRAEDNSYMAFSGQRKQCMPPETLTASNDAG